ncbi:MAG: hypothetical protein L6Q78_11080 [Bacteroidia bacterium]|nr:hypothetical protein [Bacteroidia bacterium]
MKESNKQLIETWQLFAGKIDGLARGNAKLEIQQEIQQFSEILKSFSPEKYLGNKERLEYLLLKFSSKVENTTSLVAPVNQFIGDFNEALVVFKN